MPPTTSNLQLLLEPARVVLDPAPLALNQAALVPDQLSVGARLGSVRAMCTSDGSNCSVVGTDPIQCVSMKPSSLMELEY